MSTESLRWQVDSDNFVEQGGAHGWALKRRYWFRTWTAPLFDPGCGVAAFTGALIARSLVHVTDTKLYYTAPPPSERRVHGLHPYEDRRDIFTRIRRRGMFYGLFFWLYVPVHRRAQFDMYDTITTTHRMRLTLEISLMVSMLSRLFVNVWSNVSEAARLNFMPRRHAYKFLTKHHYLPGFASLLVSQPPLLAAMTYHGSTLFMFEATRRLLRGYEPADRDAVMRSRPGPVIATAVFNGVLAAGCATVASFATYRMNQGYYKNELMRPTSLSHPWKYVQRRESILVGTTYGIFSLLQPFLSPQHSRVGFGY